MMRPRSVRSHASRIGGCEIGSSHAARYCGTYCRASLPALLRAGYDFTSAAFARRSVGTRGREAQHAGHGALAENRIAEHVVVHVAPLRHKAGILDVAHDLDLVHAVRRAGRADDVLFDHHAAHVVGAVCEAELADLAALSDPRRLQVVEVVEHDARERERAQVVDAGRLGAAELGMLAAESST